jgi:hypothetical protein
MRKHIKQISAVLIAVLVTVGLLNLDNIALAVVPGINQRVSVTSTGAQSSSGGSSPLLSANGKIAVFRGGSTILPSGGGGIFSRNLATGNITRINVSTSGVVANDTTYTWPERVSATGRYVIFRSVATNLIDGTTTPSSPNNQHLYLRDTVASTTTLITQTPTGTVANGSAGLAFGVSSDGRFVAFVSTATNLHPDATDGSAHLYMLDRINDSLSVLDRKTDGTVQPSNPSWGPVGSMSCDGSLIVFHSPNNLIVGQPSNHVNVYLLDRRGGQDKLTNLTNAADQAVTAPTISCNGDFIGLRSRATNLDPSVAVTFVYNTYRPYVYDRVNGIFHLAAVTTSNTSTTTATCGTFVDGGPCVEVSDTGLGVFSTDDSALTGASGNQAYLRDIYAGTTELVSKNSSGVAGNSGSYYPIISADGTITAYSSIASNLITGDTNNANDMFTSLTGY